MCYYTHDDDEDGVINGGPEMSNTNLVELETMPDCHRGSHRAAGNWGRYPVNGAERQMVTREEAEEVIAADPDGYAHIVGED